MNIAEEKETGKLVSATINSNDVKKSIKYICPECGQVLILKQGYINVWHFAHYNPNTDCNDYASESTIHKYWKQQIAQDILDGKTKLGHVDFVDIEHTMNGIRPDIYVKKGNKVYLIEIYNTHKKDDEYFFKVEENNKDVRIVYEISVNNNRIWQEVFLNDEEIEEREANRLHELSIRRAENIDKADKYKLAEIIKSNNKILNKLLDKPVNTYYKQYGKSTFYSIFGVKVMFKDNSDKFIACRDRGKELTMYNYTDVIDGFFKRNFNYLTTVEIVDLLIYNCSLKHLATMIYDLV